MKKCVLIKGKPVADSITEKAIEDVKFLNENNIVPCIAIVRVGENPDDMAYERGASNRCKKIGIDVENVVLESDITEKEYIDTISELNKRAEVNGILCLRPLPKWIDENRVKNVIESSKDVDCFNPVNTAKVFEGDESGFAPCTAESVVEILKYYGVELSGKKVSVIGRSMVVGKPVSMLLMNENSTVKICHSKTENIEMESADADIVVAAIGRARMINSDYIKDGAVVIDVGINVDESGNLCGDVDEKSVSEKASMLTPVPGGVGSVTTSILASHIIKACRQQNGI